MPKTRLAISLYLNAIKIALRSNFRPSRGISDRYVVYALFRGNWLNPIFTKKTSFVIGNQAAFIQPRLFPHNYVFIREYAKMRLQNAQSHHCHQAEKIFQTQIPDQAKAIYPEIPFKQNRIWEKHKSNKTARCKLFICENNSSNQYRTALKYS